jgi:hypothetical protein
VLILALAPATAQARSELLRWQHANPSTVAGFKVYVGSSSGSYQTVIDVGLPVPVNGIYSFSLQVPDPDSVYVAVSAYGPTGLEGPRSNEKLREGVLGAPGKPLIQP